MIKQLYRFLSPKFQNLFLEYKVDFKPRFGHGLPPHPQLYQIVDAQRAQYRQWLKQALQHQAQLQQIRPAESSSSSAPIPPQDPSWNNGFLPGLDIVMIYTLLHHFRPANYIEVGSGNSTKVAYKCIQDHQLPTKITSIDPYPRAEIDQLADRIIRQPFETVALDDLLALKANDILFIDNSHRVLPNSDATVFFLEVLPLLQKGVIVHIHDIYIPYDYPDFMCERAYSEQYMLAAFLLANADKLPEHVCLILRHGISADDLGLLYW